MTDCRLSEATTTETTPQYGAQYQQEVAALTAVMLGEKNAEDDDDDDDDDIVREIDITERCFVEDRRHRHQSQQRPQSEQSATTILTPPTRVENRSLLEKWHAVSKLDRAIKSGSYLASSFPFLSLHSCSHSPSVEMRVQIKISLTF